MLAALFLFFPVIALAAGIRPTDFENHKLAKFPSISSGWTFFQQLPPWATDHLATRQQWIKAYGAVNRHAFADPQIPPGIAPQQTNEFGNVTAPGAVPAVLFGKHGTLYYAYDALFECNPTKTKTQITAFLRALAATVDASGRTFLLYVPPDKTTFEPRDLPDSFSGKKCVRARSSQMWPLMATVPGFIDLRPAMERVAAASGEPLYIRTDTHWNGLAASLYVRSLIKQIEPSVRIVAPTALPVVQQDGDLSVLAGNPMPGPIQPFSIISPKDHVVSGPVLPFVTSLDDIHATGPRDALVHATTTLLCDSFTQVAQEDRLDSAFAHLYLTHYNRTDTNAADILTAIDSSKVVVLEVVQRALFSGTGVGLFNNGFLVKLKDNLAAHPLS